MSTESFCWHYLGKPLINKNGVSDACLISIHEIDKENKDYYTAIKAWYDGSIWYNTYGCVVWPYAWRSWPEPAKIREYDTISGKWHEFKNGKPVRCLTDEEAVEVIWRL